MKRTPYRGCLVGFLFLASGCASAIDAPSAYETTTYLCDDAHAAEWAAEIEACRALGDEGCAGIMSVRGVVDEQPVRASNRVESAVESVDQSDEGPVRSFRLSGRTTYFRLALTCQFLRDGRPPSSLTSNLNLEARGGNYLVGLARPAQSIQVDSPGEFAFRVQSSLTRGGTFEGCFHLFVKPAVSN